MYNQVAVDTRRQAANEQMNQLLAGENGQESAIDFSIIFFSDSQHDLNDRYKFLMDVAQYVDQNAFSSIWLPERHFHPFGGIYPDPAVLASAIAVQTKQIRLRTGSVVMPLHHPTQIVEQWAMVDNLSHGRVDLGFACGWNPNDFIVSPENYQDRKKIWFDNIPVVQKLWRGEKVAFKNGIGDEVEVSVYPRPKQPNLDVWVVITREEKSFIQAGEQGYNILTMLQGTDLDGLAKKIELYRNARAENGFDPNAGVVSLMLHTMLHEDCDSVESKVKEPFMNYIRSAVTGHIQSMDKEERPSQDEIDKIVEYSYSRYFHTGALFGSVNDACKVVDKAIEIGVNEIACLVDFGVDKNFILESLPYLTALKESYDARVNTKVQDY